MDKRYLEQVNRMLQVLPHVMFEKIFALKGGTAINFFVRNIPRLSVDIDLVYTPIQDRTTSLTGISEALLRIKDRLLTVFNGCTVAEKRVTGGYCIRLFVKFTTAMVIIEPNTVLRGTVFPVTQKEIHPALKEKVGIDSFAIVNLLAVPELYGGKIVAALDRQHPRDLFDIKILLDNEGITDEIRTAFIVYLAGHDRPIHEVLSPSLLDVKGVFKNEFEGLTIEPVDYTDLESARKRLIKEIQTSMSNDERRFLLSLIQGQPQWDLFPIDGIEKLPALQWKLMNIRKMDKNKREIQTELLKVALKL